MVRVLVQLELAAGMPRPLNGRGRASLFGIWLRERVVSIALDWPAIGFHHIDLLPDGVRLVLVPPAAMLSEAVGLAIARAVRTEVESAALACCGLRDGVVWQSSTVVVVGRETIANGDGALDRPFLVLSEATATRLRSRRTSCRR